MELSNSLHNHHMKNSRKRKDQRRERVKVVYISSPVKVKTCASRFRALVQELTGRDSDVSRYMEANNGADHDDNSQQMVLDRAGLNRGNDRISADSSTSSDSYLEPPPPPSFDDLLMNSHVQGGFLGMFPSSNLLSFDQGFEFDHGVVGGYGAV